MNDIETSTFYIGIPHAFFVSHLATKTTN